MAEQEFATTTTNFNGGEISPRMLGRTDTAIYQIALAEMLNFVPSVEGPAVKCPGFRYIAAALASASWLSSFVFSRTQAYAIAWADGEEDGGILRFFTNGGQILDGGDPYEVAVPYSAAQAPFVSAQQSYDRLYLAHRSHPLAALTRIAAEEFTYAALGLEGGPFGDLNKEKDQTIAFSASSGATTGYASAAMAAARPFTAADEGALFYVETRDYAEIPQWEQDREVAAGQLRANTEGQIYQKIGGAGKTGSVMPTHTEGAAWDGDGASQDSNAHGPFGVQWLYVHDRYGIVRIDEVVNVGRFDGTVLRRLPNSAALANSYVHPIGFDPGYSGGEDGGYYTGWEVDAPIGEDPEFTPIPGGDYEPDAEDATGYDFPGSWRWAHAAFSGTAGHPVAVLLAWGRLVAFTDFEVHGSVIGDYGGGRVNFSEYAENGKAEADMAFRRRLSISNPVLWAREDRGNILVGTMDGEYLVGPIDPGKIVSAENIQAVKQTRHGCAPVFPVDAGEEIIFAQKGGRKLRECAYSFEKDRYRAAYINIWSRHILKSGCIQLAFEQESEEMLWALRADGVLAAHPHSPEQEIKGFARRIHGAGPIRSTICIPSEDGAIDEQWALVVNSATGARSIERRDPWWEEGTGKALAFFVDSGFTITDPESLTIADLGWLAGQDVAVLCDGAVLRGLSVSAEGELTLPEMAQLPGTVTGGLPYRAHFKTLRPELRDGKGNTMQGKKQRLFKLGLRLLETLGIKVAAKPGQEDEHLQRGTDVPMGEGPAFFSGDKVREVGGGWERDGQFEVISDDPVPCIVTAAMPYLKVTE